MNNVEINNCYNRFIHGEEEAFAEIVAELHQNLVFFINRYVNNLYTAEDLAEDAFAEVLIHPNRFRFDTSFKTYLFTIGRNKAVDYLRKNKKISFSSDEEMSADCEEFEEEYCRKEADRELYRAINGLHSDYRTVVYLLYFENMSYEEVAKIMHKNKKQISNLSYRAKQTLKEVLLKEGFSYEG